MSRESALLKMRQARRLMAEAERELEEATDDEPTKVQKKDDRDARLARARAGLRKVGVAV